MAMAITAIEHMDKGNVQRLMLSLDRGSKGKYVLRRLLYCFFTIFWTKGRYKVAVKMYHNISFVVARM